MKTLLSLIAVMFVQAVAASDLPSAAFEADNFPPEAAPIAAQCGIRESHTGRQDCYQYSGSSGAICYDRSCGCHIIRSPRGCSIACNVPSCQGE